LAEKYVNAPNCDKRKRKKREFLIANEEDLIEAADIGCPL
jgi:hypothetical protein